MEFNYGYIFFGVAMIISLVLLIFSFICLKGGIKYKTSGYSKNYFLLSLATFIGGLILVSVALYIGHSMLNWY
jgi:hypothetical protein